MTIRLFSLIAILASLSNAAATSKPQPPICIVGAGVSGLTAAKALEDKGYKTVMFEKRDTVGGMCQSHYEDGQYFPLGAVLFTESPSFAETFRVVNSSGVGFDTFDPAYTYDYDPKTGSAALTQASTPAAIQALQEELTRYAGLWQNDFAPIGVPGYKATSVINRGAGNYGYGDYTQIPILYFLQFFASDIIASFIGTMQPFKTDFFEVFKHVSKTIKGSILLGVKIQRIIGVNSYFASVVRMSNLGDNLTVSQELPDPLDPFKAEGQPVYLTRLHPESSIVNVYSADDPAHPSVTRVKRHLIRDLSKINKDLENVYADSTKLVAADIRAFSGQIDYFPHLGPEALADGCFEDGAPKAQYMTFLRLLIKKTNGHGWPSSSAHVSIAGPVDLDTFHIKEDVWPERLSKASVFIKLGSYLVPENDRPPHKGVQCSTHPPVTPTYR
uniref:Amine oxidase domain-containing protein n=1 Tax=Fusarium oxysporum (strain Fo5176) TaxID=660025 RepID=A0A0C4BL30_FUSOF